MCNLNILFRTSTAKDIKPFLMGVTSVSYTNNNDGEGFYCDGLNSVIKQRDKINYLDYKAIDKSLKFISHQRFSTSGFKVKFNHPFGNKRFIVVHNGVINQFQNHKSESDTIGFFKEFNKQFEKIRKLNPTYSEEKVLISVIDELFKNDEGSYSIFILDKKTNLGYYFKDNTTRINFYRNNKGKDYLYITTNSNNYELLSLLDCGKCGEIEILPRVIYRIDKTKVYKVFKMREVKRDYTPPTPAQQKVLSVWKDNTTAKDDYSEYLIKNKGLQDAYYCCDCFNALNDKVYSLDYKHVLCEDCLKFELKHSITAHPKIKKHPNYC